MSDRMLRRELSREMWRRMHRAMRMNGRQWYRDDPLEERMGMAMIVRDKASGGRVGVIYGGMDCDCTAFSRSTVLPAVPRAVERWIEKFHEGAEGPQWQYIDTPERAEEYVGTSRDLALEAFEDGHQHVVYYPGV